MISVVDEREILLVEDDENDVELMRGIIGKHFPSLRLVVAIDGLEAINRIFGDGRGPLRPQGFKMVILDLKLPRVDGFEVLRRLKEDARTRRIPVVVFTSSQQERDIARAYDLGANSYIVKPVDFDDYAKLVGQIEAYWYDRNRTVA